MRSLTNGGQYQYNLNGNMTSRIENNVTYTQTWDAENRLTIVTSTVSAAKPVSRFTYDGDGNRVMQVQISGTQVMTTAYAGAIEVQITATQRITKTYYSAGSQLIAMRQYTTPTSSVLYFLHSDHLGSVSVTTCGTGCGTAGTVLSRQKFDAWGNVRSGSGAMPTDVAFTRQRENLEIGLHYFKARYYVPYLNRWLQPDTIVPDPSNPQSLNRFSYVQNNPLKYTDPSGHCITNSKTKDGGYEQTRGNYFDCSIDELNALEWDARSWWIGQLGNAAGSPGWFKNIQTVLNFFRDTPGLSDLNSWASAADAPLLWVIQQGYRLYMDPHDITVTTNRWLQTGTQAWSRFFESKGQEDQVRINLWGQAEQLGTRAGIEYADRTVARPTELAGAILDQFISIGNSYRSYLATQDCNCGLDIFLGLALTVSGANDPRTDTVQYGIILAKVRGVKEYVYGTPFIGQ